MYLFIQDLLPAIFKLSDFVPKGLLRIFKDPCVPTLEDSPAFLPTGNYHSALSPCL
jgi:hypothetical protein